MSSFFSLLEPSNQKASELALPPFAFNSAHPLIKSARVLLGSAVVAYGDKNIKLTYNWLTKDTPAYSPLRIAKYISDDSDTEKLSKLLKSYSRSNVSFFKKLEDEIVQIVLFHKLNRHTECFLHIYRCIEYISDAVPVLYLDKVNNFSESISIINSIAQNKIGELNALSRVCKLIADRGDEFKDLKFTIDLSNTSLQDAKGIKSQLNSINVSCDTDWSDNTLDVEYSKMADFIVTVRNRAFHYMRNQKNIDFSVTGGANVFFSTVNEVAISWLAIVYFQLLESLHNRHVISTE